MTRREIYGFAALGLTAASLAGQAWAVRLGSIEAQVIVGVLGAFASGFALGRGGKK